ncbi:MAG: hypothetical protein BHW18_07595 [Eubacterium sp. 36_13]|nr:MAG: hypothetical protein BHW18_07595 [Eubacterium sp. 36_13]
MKKKNVKICVVGGGKIGSEIAAQLTDNGCEVTVIDTNLDLINKISNAMDVICYQGNGASLTILQDAGAAEADIFIAVTGSDELNILSCLTAHSLGAKNTIARVRNAEYAVQSEFYMEKFGLSMTINPDFTAAREIERLLHFPQATKIELFGKGRCELAEMKIEHGNAIIGKTLFEINQKMKMNILICAIVRDKNIFIPNGDDIVKEGDVLYITGSPKAINESLEKMNIKVRRISSVLIAGASRIGFYLSKMLEKDGVNVTVVEKVHSKAAELAGNVPGVSVMCSDAMANNDEYNLIAGMLAEKRNVYKVVTKMNSHSALKELQMNTKICSVSKESAVTDIIIGYSRSLLAAENFDAISSLYRLMDGKLEFVEFKVTSDEAYLGKLIKELQVKKGYIIASIIRNRRLIVPRGDDVIEKGDSVLVCTVNKSILRLQDIFAGV